MTLGEFITALGYATGLAVYLYVAKRRKLLTQGMAIIAYWALFGGFLGAKLGEFLAEGWPISISPLTIFDATVGGRAILGGLLGGWLAVYIAKRRMGIVRSTGDLFAYALPAGEAVGRIGCYFNGCCYGKATSFPIAIYQHGAWRHPTQLYSSACALATLAVVFAVRKHVRKEGDLFKVYLLLFGATRFAIEFLREGKPVWLGLTAMQFLCLELVIFCGLGLVISVRRKHLSGQQATSSV
jgi:phosphatidylglycerol:prolipoprotein diacylglycerol transferase